jgi:hypothetical protein
MLTAVAFDQKHDRFAIQSVLRFVGDPGADDKVSCRVSSLLVMLKMAPPMDAVVARAAANTTILHTDCLMPNGLMPVE